MNAVLNRYSMYLIVRAYLGVLIVAAAGLSFLGLLPYDPLNLIGVSLYLIAVALASNWVLARLFRADASLDSPIITALILTLIISPHAILSQWVVAGAIAAIAMASKYVLAWHAKHIFNPAAFAVVVGAIALNQGASWWVGNELLLPLVLVGGAVVMQKIHRWRLLGAFLGTFLVFTAVAFILGGNIVNLPDAASSLVLASPLFFFGFVLLPEPATSPEKLHPQMYYGISVAVLIVILQYGVGIGYGFELALLGGNVLARLLEPSRRYKLTLHSTQKEADDTYSFWFRKPHGFDFRPGQFMVWTLPHRRPDNRGNRRWFTLASSPTENSLMIAMRFSDSSSSFKRALGKLEAGDALTATGPGGGFTLPEDPEQPLIWITGGIGITPFRSMVQYLYDSGEQRSITLFYGNGSPDEIAFKTLLDEKAEAIGMDTVYTLTGETPSDWSHEHGLIDADMIKRHAPNYYAALFYLSGPQPMVEAFETTLRDMGIKRENIVTDYFPGYEDEHAQ